jgi:aspartyl protease family protein
MCRCRSRIFATRLAGLAGALLCAAAQGQTVTLNGSIGERAALLVIDGQPKTVTVGATVQGVKLLGLTGTGAEVEIAGQRRTLTIGSPVSVGAAARASGSQILLPAGPGGHFFSGGSINGRQVRFVVDTGATSVALSQADAERIGLDWRGAPAMVGQTANGTVSMHVVKLAAVRIGDVEVTDVDAVVVPGAMPFVLLGNSFLSRFRMRRDADVLVLERRY